MATETQVKQAKDVTLLITEYLAEKLDALVKYKYQSRIALQGVMSIEKEMQYLRGELISDLITSRHDSLLKQETDRVDKKKSAYFRFLVSKGEDIGSAYKKAYEQ